MKLVITDKKGKIDCLFKGNIADAVTAIVMVMKQEPLMEKIMKCAVESYEVIGQEIED